MGKADTARALGYSERQIDLWGLHYFDKRVVSVSDQLFNWLGHGAITGVPATGAYLLADWSIWLAMLPGTLMLVGREIIQLFDSPPHVLDRVRDVADGWTCGVPMVFLFAFIYGRF